LILKFQEYKNSKTCVKIKIENISEFEIFNPEEPKRVKSKWPAIIFAVNRIDKVKGRIINLIDSIRTIKGISMKGVPEGVKWINKLFR